MPAELLIGVDIGTQGTKAAIFNLEGELLSSAFRQSQLRQPGGGIVEEDPEVRLVDVCSTISKCVGATNVSRENIAAVGIAGQMAGILGIGASGRAVTPYDSWLDTRCAPYIAVMQKEAGGEIARKTGGPPSFNHGPKILWWRNERSEIYRTIKKFCQPGAYAVMRLCGMDVSQTYIDSTYLHFSGFADNQRSAWDNDLCRTFAIDTDKLPRIVPPSMVVGELVGDMASSCGIKPGIPVVAGCGDTAASFLACGATRSGICVDVAGTASVFAATTKQFIPDVVSQTLSCSRSATPGLWHPYAYVNGGGMNLEWFNKEIARGLSFSELDEQAGRIVLSKDLPLFIPHLAGRVSPAWPNLRGAFAGLTWSHGIAHLYRSILEGVALEYGLYREILRELDSSFLIEEVRVTGGGERSAVWNAIKAGVIGSPVVQMRRSEGAPMGAALLAGLGVSLFADLDGVAQSWAKPGAVTCPRPEELAIYAHRLERYRRLLDQLKPWDLL
jgi:xylulokinase